MRPVFFLGPVGTFCHQAALYAFANAKDRLVPCASILAVFEALAAESDAEGVVPVENSIEGGVGLTSECLLEFGHLSVTGEVVVEVNHCLLSEGPLSSVHTVQSHVHALPQCKHWLHAHLPHAAQVPVASTALAAQNAKGKPGVAAISSALAAELFGLPVLARNIQDRAHNATRFLVLGRQAPARTGADKTSIVFGARHERGALYRALAVFDRYDINLSRIESRPEADRLWQYVFFADCDGHRDDPNVRSALKELAEVALHVRVLGSYPRAASASSQSAASAGKASQAG